MSTLTACLILTGIVALSFECVGLALLFFGLCGATAEARVGRPLAGRRGRSSKWGPSFGLNSCVFS
jgi:hypothetical protein